MGPNLWVSPLLLLGCLVAADVQLCSEETDCAPSETCRRLCDFRGQCRSICVTSSVKARILRRSTSVPPSGDKENSEPFTDTTDPFTEESSKEAVEEATPQTFSEEDFEKELRESSPDLFSSSPAAPPSIPPSSEHTEAMPPSLKPEAPGYEQYKTGYTKVPPTTLDHTEEEEDETSPPTTEESTTGPTPPSPSTSTTGGSAKKSWIVTSTFAPALGVEKTSQSKQPGYSTDDAEISSTIAEETNESASPKVLEQGVPKIELPVEKSAYFAGVTHSPRNGLPPTTAETVEITEEATQGQGLPETSTPAQRSPSQKYDNEEAGVQEGESRSECPSPVPCGKNCGIFIDDNGCQGCQCLWKSITCVNDTDCSGEGLFCDDGRCECRIGYLQDMLQSGACRVDPDFQELGGNDVSDQAVHQTTIGAYLRRTRRASTKPSRMERLQWPGPCDNDNHCPPNLYCIQGDCWHLPNKPIRSLQHDPPPKSFPIDGDSGEEEDYESDAKRSSVRVPSGDEFDFKLFPSPPPSGKKFGARSRFFTTTEPDHYDSQEPGEDYDLLSTTAPETTTTTSTTSSTTTTTPPSTTTATTQNPEAFTKMIEVPDFSEIVRKRTNRLRTTPSPSDEDDSEPPLDPVEFPISSRLQKERLAKNKKKNKTRVRPTTTTTTAPSVARTSFNGPTGVWHPMEGPDEYIPKPFPQMPENARVFLEYTEENRRRKPVRVELYRARDMIHDECRRDEDCGRTFVCCEKKWCDLTPDCGNAKFCLPHCDMTKMTYLSSMGVGGVPLIDVVYD